MTRSTGDDRSVPAADDASGDSLTTLTALLWREREVLERLLFRLVEQQLILATGDVRWLPAADAEVHAAAQAVQVHEVARAAEVEEVVAERGLPGDLTLQQLAESVPEPWPGILLEHRDALRLLTAEIDEATASNRRLLHTGEAVARDALARLSGQDRPGAPSRGDYTVTGNTGPIGRAFILDERA